MRSSTLVFFSLLSSAFAFQVTRPSQTNGWTNSGAQTVSWDRVSTDSTNFTLVLTNQNRQLLAQDLVIASFVDAVAASTTNVSPPSSGWPTPGDGYRVNLVKSATEPTTIYAQSNQFSIKAGAATATASGSTAAGLASGASTTPAAGATGTTAGTTTGTSPNSGAAAGGNTSDAEDTLGAAPNLGNGASSASGVSLLSAGLFSGFVAFVGSTLL